MTRDILDREGVAGMYRGLTATILREIPGYFLFFGGYDVCRHLFATRGEGEIGESVTQ